MNTTGKRATTRKTQATPESAPPPAPTTWIATTSFVCTIDGRSYNVTKDQTRVAEGHPVMRGREHLFRRADDGLTFGIEEATDTPGERRGG